MEANAYGKPNRDRELLRCIKNLAPATSYSPRAIAAPPSSFAPSHPVAEDATSEPLFFKHKPTNPKYETKNNPPRNCHHSADPLPKHLRAGML